MYKHTLLLILFFTGSALPAAQDTHLMPQEELKGAIIQHYKDKLADVDGHTDFNVGEELQLSEHMRTPLTITLDTTRPFAETIDDFFMAYAQQLHNPCTAPAITTRVVFLHEKFLLLSEKYPDKFSLNTTLHHALEYLNIASKEVTALLGQVQGVFSSSVQKGADVPKLLAAPGITELFNRAVDTSVFVAQVLFTHSTAYTPLAREQKISTRLALAVERTNTAYTKFPFLSLKITLMSFLEPYIWHDVITPIYDLPPSLKHEEYTALASLYTDKDPNQALIEVIAKSPTTFDLLAYEYITCALSSYRKQITQHHNPDSVCLPPLNDQLHALQELHGKALSCAIRFFIPLACSRLSFDTARSLQTLFDTGKAQKLLYIQGHNALRDTILRTIKDEDTSPLVLAPEHTPSS